jgi:hypothetical protein
MIVVYVGESKGRVLYVLYRHLKFTDSSNQHGRFISLELAAVRSLTICVNVYQERAERTRSILESLQFSSLHANECSLHSCRTWRIARLSVPICSKPFCSEQVEGTCVDRSLKCESRLGVKIYIPYSTESNIAW